MKKVWNEPAFDAPAAIEGPVTAGLREREPAACARLMRRYNPLLFHTARSILVDEGQAEHAVQDAWLRAFATLHAFRGECSLRAWLVRIVLHEARQRQRA